MSQEYLDFEITTSGENPPYPVGVKSTLGSATGSLVFPPDIGEKSARLEKIDCLGRPFYQKFGKALFKALFAGDVLEIYRAAFAQAKATGAGLRLRLSFSSTQLAALPWEMLFDPFQDLFMAIDPATLLTRFTFAPQPIRPLEVQPPLRILVIISSPKDAREKWGLDELDEAKERRGTHAALGQWKREGLVALSFTTQANMTYLRRRIREFKPHVVHYIGHGLIEKGTPSLLLKKGDGSGRFVDGETLKELFLRQDETRLVFLNACDTAQLAAGLVRRGVPGVIAMRYPLADEAAIALAREFYRCLAWGDPVDKALNEARRALYLDLGPDLRDWATPILFLQAEDGALFSMPQRIEREETPLPRSAGPDIGRELDALYAQAQRFLREMAEGSYRPPVSLRAETAYWPELAKMDIESLLERIKLLKGNLATLRKQQDLYGPAGAPLHLINSLKATEEELVRAIGELRAVLERVY